MCLLLFLNIYEVYSTIGRLCKFDSSVKHLHQIYFLRRERVGDRHSKRNGVACNQTAIPGVCDGLRRRHRSQSGAAIEEIAAITRNRK